MDKKDNHLNIEKTKDEIISIYDENDNYIGKDSRINMRKNNLIHRCTTILILNEKNDILVQTRALTKEYCPGYLSAVSGGIVCEGENVESNAEKELEEELGIDLNKTKYSCSIGLAYRNNKNTSLQDLIRQAEKAMYDNKAEYYKTSKKERRK